MRSTEQSFELYLHDLHDLPLLTREDEQRLAARLHAGHEAEQRLASEPAPARSERPALARAVADAEQARAELVAAHLRLVVRIARQYTSRGVSLLDLIQEGNLALIQAAAQFDPEHGVRFATYATWWIRHAIARAVADIGRAIRLPDDVRLKVYRLYRARNELTQQLEREPSDSELAQATGLQTHEARALLQYLQPVLSLDAPVREEGDDELIDIVPDPVAEFQLSDILQGVLAGELEALLQHVTPEERKVLTLRFGLGDQTLRSRHEVAARLHITVEQAQRLEARALRKLRDPELLQRLQDLMDH